MKKLAILTAIACAVTGTIGLLAFRKAEQRFDDIFRQLGISRDDAGSSVKFSFFQGQLNIPRSTKYKALLPSSRPAAVKEIGEYIKKEVASPGFKKQYAEERGYARPVLPDHSTELKEKIEEFQNTIKETEDALKTAKGEMKEMYQTNLKLYKEQLAILKNPAHPDHVLYAGTSPELIEMEKEEYKTQMAEFEKNYPADVMVLVKNRIQRFLDLTSNIDFNVKLVSRNGKMRFEDSELEEKDSQWKLCFRAGRETIAAAREFAQNWLKELK